MENTIGQPAKVSKMRSPAYPAINLETAIKRAKVFYDHEKRNAANMSVAISHWGFKPKSSGGMVSVAAMKSFGLLADQGSGQSRSLRLTDLALRILLDERVDSSDRIKALKDAALNPKIHQVFWKRWGMELPSEGNFRHALIFDYRFNENSVVDVIREYKDTVAYAKLTQSDKLSEEHADTGSEGEEPETEDPMTDQSQNPPDPSIHTTRKNTPLNDQKIGQISTPVGKQNGQIVFAHVNFDGGITKEFVASLKKYLDYLETTLQ